MRENQATKMRMEGTSVWTSWLNPPNVERLDLLEEILPCILSRKHLDILDARVKESKMGSCFGSKPPDGLLKLDQRV